MMMSGKKFTTIDNIVSAVLLEIGDEKDRQYYTRALQWVIDEYRRLNVHHAPGYKEKKVELETDRYSAPYPDDALKILSVGVYIEGEFWPFTKKPNMSKYPEDAEDNIYQSGDREGSDIVSKGVGFGFRGKNIGYFNLDPANCLIYVANYRWDKINEVYSNNSSTLTGKVIVRYKTNGLDCSEDMCIPYEFRELIVALVTFRFMKKHIPVRPTNYQLQLQQTEIDVRQEEFNEFNVGIDNFWEIRDAFYNSLNTTARR